MCMNNRTGNSLIPAPPEDYMCNNNRTGSASVQGAHLQLCSETIVLIFNCTKIFKKPYKFIGCSMMGVKKPMNSYGF